MVSVEEDTTICTAYGLHCFSGVCAHLTTIITTITTTMITSADREGPVAPADLGVTVMAASVVAAASAAEAEVSAAAVASAEVWAAVAAVSAAAVAAADKETRYG